MYPSHHLFFGAIFGASLLFLFPQIGFSAFLVVVLSTTLIDVDHYLWYVCKKKNWDLKNAYNWFIEIIKKSLLLSRKQRNGFYGAFSFLHGIEILFILFLFGILVSNFYLFMFVGAAFHLLLDVIDETIYHDRIDKFSIIHTFFKLKKLKFMGNL